MEQEQTFVKIFNHFTINIQSIRVFNEQIGSLADEHDRNVMQQFTDRVNELLPEIEDSEGTVEIVGSNGETGAPNGADGNTGASEEPIQLPVDADTMWSLLHTLRSTAKQSPGQGPLLRQGALITLVSFFEILVSDLIQIFYRMNPGALPDRSLSLADLRRLGSIEDAENQLAYEEADSIVRESLDVQLKYFTDRPKVNLGPLDAERKFLTEVFQRRHLLVHNNGVVNQQYRRNVDRELVEEYEAEVDRKLTASKRYLDAAIDTVYTAGVSLLQLCWRKWDKGSTDVADTIVINDILVESLNEKRFGLTVRMCERLKGMKCAVERSAGMVRVNHAIALKGLNRSDEMEEILRGDWSTFGRDFELALHALRNEEEQFYELLPLAIHGGYVTKQSLEEWPVFADQRETEQFNKALEKYFGAETSSDSSDDDADPG